MLNAASASDFDFFVSFSTFFVPIPRFVARNCTSALDNSLAILQSVSALHSGIVP